MSWVDTRYLSIFWVKFPRPHKLNPFTPTWDTLEAHQGHSETVLGWYTGSGTNTSGHRWARKLKCWKGPKRQKSYPFFTHTQPFHTDLGHCGDTLGISRNYSRVVHLGWEVHLWNQMNTEKCHKERLTTQKLKTYKKCSTLLHQPGTPGGDTRNI